MNENVVFVGKKPLVKYAYAVVTQISNGQKEVHIVARGKQISRAVDTFNFLKRKFLNNIKLKEVKIGSEEVEREVQGKGKIKARVSFIDITVTLS